MAIEAKASFLAEIERKLAPMLTVEEMAKTITAISDVMQGYDMMQTFREMQQQDDLLDGYLDALKVMGRSQKTIDRYAYVIRKMQDFVKVPIRQINVYHLRSYLASKKEHGMSDRSLEGEREVFSAYFGWLQRESLIDKNPTANLGKIKYTKKQKKTFSEVDLAKLGECCDNVRDRAIICFLSATGCRISEVMELNRDQVNLDELECTVHGKGNKERIVYLDPVAAMYLRKYLDERKDENEAMFLNCFGRRMQPGGVRGMLNKVAKRAGVEHVHPHKFRRTKATDLSRHGMPMEQIKILLGHDKIDTTMEYVNIDNNEIKHSYKMYS